MNRGIWIALALLAAAPAHAQDEVKKDSTGTKAAPTAKPGVKKGKAAGKGTGKKDSAASGSAAWGTGGGASKESVASKKTATAAPHAADRAAMLRARAVYRYAVDSCTQSGKGCDTAMRDDAEVKFIDACLPCATRAQCEAERDLIRAGDSKTTTSLCVE